MKKQGRVELQQDVEASILRILSESPLAQGHLGPVTLMLLVIQSPLWKETHLEHYSYFSVPRASQHC